MSVIEQMEMKRKMHKAKGHYERAERMRVMIADYRVRLEGVSTKQGDTNEKKDNSNNRVNAYS